MVLAPKDDRHFSIMKENAGLCVLMDGRFVLCHS